MTSTNGKVTQNIESMVVANSVDPIIKSEKSQKNVSNQNKYRTINLDLDAGSSQAKFVVNDWCGSYPSVAKEISGELPIGISGCFSIGSKNYAVGQVTNSLGGKIIEGFKDNKIKYLHVWLIGALTTHPDLLSMFANERKYKKQPVRVKVNLRLLSLSSSKKDDISKVLQQTKEFTCEGVTYQLEIVNSDYLFPESYGAALEATKSIPSGITRFHLLDLGGGTLTLSTYQIGAGLPRAIEQTASSGCGMKAILARLSIALARVDRGGLQFYKENLESALRNSKPLGGGRHSVKYRHGQESLEIGEIVEYALSEWVAESPIVETLLSRVSQALLDGSPVFATGGSMAVSAVAEWIERYVCLDIENPQFFILDNPQNINLTGLRHLNNFG